MATLTSARQMIGKLFGGNPPTQGQQLQQTVTVPSAPAPSQSSGNTINLQLPPQSPALTTSEMTPTQLRARRIAQIENADIGQSKHIRFFIFLVTCWLFVGPPWYVILTTSEVGWSLSRRPFNWTDQTSVNFYAGALFIELGQMFCTFFLAYLRQIQAEQENKNRTINRTVTGLTVVWFLLAAVSAYGQFYYLFNASGVSHEMFHIVFVSSRVIAFTIVDFASAFYLSRIQTTLDELMEANRKKGQYHVQMAAVDAELMKKEMDAEMMVEQAKTDQEDRRNKNALANRIISIMTDAGVREIENKFNSNQLPPPSSPSNNQNVP